MDFALVLVVLTAISGFIWGLEVFYRRVVRSGDNLPLSSNMAVDYARSFFPVLLFVLVIRSFIYEPFRIPSGSMIPTLLVGDFIFVSKFEYGLRLPVAHTKILDLGEPQRGDVIVFRLPSDPSVNYIKRLVGLPGDTVIYSNRRLFINGTEVPLGPMKRAHGPGIRGGLVGTEDLGGVKHEVIHDPVRISRQGKYVVPDGHYFMMGDNRDNSQDSRFPQVGFVPEENVVGKAVRIWMSWDFQEAPQWMRIGSEVR